tara:strand:- start:311 stop:505 length:195 start_codon:yes stop_codon:yes gene_type:complete
MEENTLPNNKIRVLRMMGILTENEVAVSQGDLLIAVDVITQQRRVIEAPDNLVESNDPKRLLKG